MKFDSLQPDIPDDLQGSWYWIADYCECNQDGTVKFFSQGKEIAYPWILIDDVYESK